MNLSNLIFLIKGIILSISFLMIRFILHHIFCPLHPYIFIYLYLRIHLTTFIKPIPHSFIFIIPFPFSLIFLFIFYEILFTHQIILVTKKSVQYLFLQNLFLCNYYPQIFFEYFFYL